MKFVSKFYHETCQNKLEAKWCDKFDILNKYLIKLFMKTWLKRY